MFFAQATPDISPWAQFGLAGLVICALFGVLGLIIKWAIVHIDKTHKEFNTERERLLASFREERDITRGDHRAEREQWLGAVRDTSEKIVSAVDRLSDIVKNHQ